MSDVPLNPTIEEALAVSTVVKRHSSVYDYVKAWRQAHPEKVREYNKKYALKRRRDANARETACRELDSESAFGS